MHRILKAYRELNRHGILRDGHAGLLRRLEGEWASRQVLHERLQWAAILTARDHYGVDLAALDLTIPGKARAGILDLVGQEVVVRPAEPMTSQEVKDLTARLGLSETLRAPRQDWRRISAALPAYGLSESFRRALEVWCQRAYPVPSRPDPTPEQALDLPDGRPLMAHQPAGIAHLVAGRALLADEPGLGKAQPIDAGLLTPSGMVQMGNVSVGMPIIGRDGQTHIVVGVFPQGIKDVYRVVLSDGSYTECCLDHLWSITSSLRRLRNQKPQILPLKDFMDKLRDNTGKRIRYIPMIEPVLFPDQNLELDPYVLGVLLGDGALSQHGVSFTKYDRDLAENVVMRLPPLHRVTERLSVNKATCWGIVGPNRLPGSNLVRKAIVDFGLAGKTSGGKFIPQKYLIGSIKQRLDLFHGMMDTDGSVSDNHLEWSSSSFQMANEFVWLVESIGGLARISQKKTYRLTNYRVSISIPNTIKPFTIIRKMVAYRGREKYPPVRIIDSVEYVGKKECVCISTSASDHLYVTDRFIVTHNTVQAARAAACWVRRTGCRVILIAPASTLRQWREVLAPFAQEGLTDVDLVSWASIPEPDRRRPFYLLVDEVHLAANSRSKRAHALVRLARSRACLGFGGLTGTPIPSGEPADLFPLMACLGHPAAKGIRAFQARWPAGSEAALIELGYVLAPYVLGRAKEECTDIPPKVRVVWQDRPDPDLMAAHTRQVRDVMEAYRAGGQDQREETIGRVQLMASRQASSILRVPLTAARVRDLPGQAVLFTCFVESARMLAAELGGILVTGETSQTGRRKAVQSFRSGKSRYFVATAQAAGTGLDGLQCCQTIVAHDRPWTAADCQQLEDRVWRLGVAGPVTAYWPRAFGVDEVADRVASRKAARAGLVMPGQDDLTVVREDDLVEE